jgi:hypothetical protein
MKFHSFPLLPDVAALIEFDENRVLMDEGVIPSPLRLVIPSPHP